MFIGWIPQPTCTDGKPFVLHHSNSDKRDFLVSEDGSLRAITGWRHISINPRIIGNEAHPGWLTRDWDSLVYVWSEEME